ncbi:uncharacterized protein RSE6_14578 [Rhynchosporium secalis]|uniref:Reverse transcriptase domain-containing protein n=1 Tax=Rhynchosporium secalis TaxID=38038 RepID=A0A1E1MVL1_RHYSE|nr:uncharacterized protein RSE6_14578 [Rhynchosporium secalis]
MYFSELAAATFGLFVTVSGAHPGADHRHEAREHMAAIQAAHLPNDLSHCSEILRRESHERRTVERRIEVLRSEREIRGLPMDGRILKPRGSLIGRDAPTVLKTDYRSKTMFGPESKHTEIFANSSCVLTPYITCWYHSVVSRLRKGDISGRLNPGADTRLTRDYGPTLTLLHRLSIDELLICISKAVVFTKLDIRAVFNRIYIDPDSEEYTTFRTRFGSYKYKRYMNNILLDYLDDFCIAYLDNILIYSETLQEYEEYVNLVL